MDVLKNIQTKKAIPKRIAFLVYMKILSKMANHRHRLPKK